ncbi:MAG: PPC domain-containing protein [Nevskiaceae bacterium]
MSTRSTLLALLLSAPGLAQAAPEVEVNHPIAIGQAVGIGDIAVDGSATTGAIIDGVVGNLSGAAVQDLDYFVFEGKEGDVITLDIDGGIGGARSVDTIIGVFGPAPSHQLLRMNDDAGAPLDPGSTSGFDSRIANFRLPADGTYTVGVSSYPRRFVNGGGVSSSSLGANANGDYKLLISGVSVSTQQINIDIKPGSGDVAPINPKARGRVPVALLGSGEFSVEDVDMTSLTFGHTGNEASLARCGGKGDVNGDAFPDMVCHFENQAAKFDSSDEEAILRGELKNGSTFEGRGWLKVVPVKAQH